MSIAKHPLDTRGAASAAPLAKDVARLDKVDFGQRPVDVRHAGLEPAEVIGQVPVDVHLKLLGRRC